MNVYVYLFYYPGSVKLADIRCGDAEASLVLNAPEVSLYPLILLQINRVFGTLKHL